MCVRWLMTIVLLAGVLAGCRSAEHDAWYRAPPTGGDPYWTWAELDETRLYQVAEEQQAAAQALLGGTVLVALSADQAAAYVGQPLPTVPGTTPYLVRGLYRNPSTGRFSAFYQGDRLVVLYGSLGSGRAPLRRCALVLQLEQKPSEVYVYVTMAQ